MSIIIEHVLDILLRNGNQLIVANAKVDERIHQLMHFAVIIHVGRIKTGRIRSIVETPAQKFDGIQESDRTAVSIDIAADESRHDLDAPVLNHGLDVVISSTVHDTNRHLGISQRLAELYAARAGVQQGVRCSYQFVLARG